MKVNGFNMNSRGMTTNKQRRIGVPTSAKFGGLSSILAPIIYIYCCMSFLIAYNNQIKHTNRFSKTIQMYKLINDFINSLDTKLYDKIAKSKSDSECRRYLKEHLQNNFNKPVLAECLGVAKFVKNATGHSKMKHLTVGKEYEIIKRFSREDIRKYRPNHCDGFEIIKDNGKSAVYYSETFFEVKWL